MPRKKECQRKPLVEHTRIALRVESYEARAEACINHHVYEPQYAVRLDERDPVYEFKATLTITGKSAWPEDRAGDTYELTIYGDGAPSRQLDITLKDAQARTEHGASQYREYRGRQIPVYALPQGMGLINKIRGEPRWNAWVFVARQFVQDALTILNQERPLFISLHERKENRARWVQGLTVQTIDPEIE